MALIPKSPDKNWLANLVQDAVLCSSGYSITTPQGISIKLDQNEMPFDWPTAIKRKIIDRLEANWSWNRYPPDYHRDLEANIAQHMGIESSCVLIAPGSNHLLAIAMDTFCLNCNGSVRLAQPSFPLYAEHALYYSIPYKPWLLNQNFQYDPSSLNDLPESSVVIFASPNNPTGTILPFDSLANLLEQHPTSLFIADEAYYEFSDHPYTSLLETYSNLILVRTFSKTLGGAMIRLGYAMGATETIAQMRKLMLPYLVNPFTYEAGKAALNCQEMQQFISQNVSSIRQERDRQFKIFKELESALGMSVIKSEANFLMIKWAQSERMHSCEKALLESGCLVRNISRGPGLKGCLRISIGTRQENEAVVTALRNSI